MRKVFKPDPVSSPVPAIFGKDFYTLVPIGDGIVIPIFYSIPANGFSVNEHAYINCQSVIVDALSCFGIGYFFFFIESAFCIK